LRSRRLIGAALALALIPAAADAERRPLSDLKKQQDADRKALERDVSSVSDDAPQQTASETFEGCLDRVNDVWTDCARPAFVAMFDREPELLGPEEDMGILGVALSLREGAFHSYVSAGYIPPDKRDDPDIAWLLEPPEEAVSTARETGVPGAYAKPFEGWAVGERIPDHPLGGHELYGSYTVDFMCGGLSITVGRDERLPRDLGFQNTPGDPSYEAAKTSWESLRPQVHAMVKRAAEELREHRVCMPGQTGVAEFSDDMLASPQRGEIIGPILQDFFDHFWEGYRAEAEAFGWAPGAQKLGDGAYGFDANAPSLDP